MAEFRHKSLKADGGVMAGRIEAASDRDAFARLQEKGLDPFEIKPVAGAGRGGLAARLRRGPSAKERARWVRQLATLLAAGLPLMEAMDSMGRGGHPQLRDQSRALRQSLRAGERLSTALAQHMPDLPDYVARLAELGEGTGALAGALGDAATRMEQQNALRGEIRSALTYPAFLAGTGVLITLFMFTVVVPRFEKLIGDNTDNLPFLSRLVLSSSALFRDHVWVVGLALAAALVGGVGAVRSPRVRRQTRELLDKTPLIGPFLARADLANWARTMGVAMTNGADLLTAFDLASRAVSSPAFAQGLREARRAVRAGQPLDEALAEGVALDATFTDLVRTGRQAAAMDRMLLFISDILDDEARERAKRLTTLAEPVAILLIALVVGTLVLGIVLAMTSLYDFNM
ncbi:general secretion pathway protein F [Rhodothalassium salexigens DSM 2132]|uniref:General secretion pathway protein F n=1 Tax=Rhodothalassium salexigens DSM 2132 TaxID=1188247 RepID=A0A4V6NQS4_RHOSA|nr:type II secretion system F family protein [Rhodothalassium salexigens]MBB4212092.1 type II secretory pathway component PulF [Rhodothalassium salexigens DSM 2132]MBK1638308.1 hypothetical protein [Rhodothalassium salexigens DSM 2132]TCP32966.1 general secretion pathway protein F [Rhodothalassium salexigens DSM 2132]